MVSLLFLSLSASALAQGVSFTPSVIDNNNSGDCKAVADLNGDGKADLIIGGASLCWYESGADFTKHVIRAQATEEYTTDMQAADLDGDGDIDLIIPDGGGNNNILWFENPRLNTPAGVSSNPAVGSNWLVHTIGTHGQYVHDLEVADLDNDGRLDVVTSGHGFTHVWKQNSPTSWSERDLSQIASEGVFLGDIDRDGFKDIATPRGWIHNPAGNLLNGNWAFRPIDNATTGDECLLADLDGDGRVDILTCDAHQSGAFVWFQQPSDLANSNWTRRVIDEFMGSHHPEAADFNLDGRPDILMGLELRDLSVYVNLGGAPPTFLKVQIDTEAAHNARVGDIDGNGTPDILGCDYITNPPIMVYLNQAAPPCYVNCDGSDGTPILTANDFQCYLNKFAAGDAVANCDNSVVAPLLNANDFQCFMNKFAAGCP